MLRRIIVSIILISILISSLSVVIFADDKSPSSWAQKDVNEAVSLGLVPANLQSNYQATITREEFASLFITTAFAFQKNRVPEEDLVGSFGTHGITKDEFANGIVVKDYSFTDTNNPDVKIAYMMGLVNGTSATTFTPKANITRQEAAVMLVNYTQLHLRPDYAYYITHISDLSKTATWARDSVIAALDKEFFLGVAGDKNNPESKVVMDPLGNFTREQAITVALRMYNVDMLSTIKIRGHIQYIEHALKLKWEITKDTITAVGFKPGMDLDYHEDGLWTDWKLYSPVKDMTVPTKCIVAASPESSYLWSEVFPTQMVAEIALGGNHTYDLGYATYEVNNPNYIFRYTFKNNGVHNHRIHGGSLMLYNPYVNID